MQTPKQKVRVPLSISKFNRGLSIRTIEPLRPENPTRRESCRYDLNLFALTYCSQYYVNPSDFHTSFCANLQRMCLSKYGVHKLALAAPRGIGKTTAIWILILWCILYKHRQVILIIGPAAPKATERLDIVKLQFFQNEMLKKDFPEMTGWVASFGSEGNRCPEPYVWKTAEFKMINNVWVIGAGAEASIPGINKDGKRPDLIICDDMETLDVCRSKTMSETLEERLRKEILFLHENGGNAAYIKICTIRRPNCIADRFTNPEIEPSWRGKRYAGLINKPEREDMWEEFMAIYKGRDYKPKTKPEVVAKALSIAPDEFVNLEPVGQRLALHYYFENRKAMDAGVKVLDNIRMPVHQMYTTIAADGWEAFACEIQNDPPKNENRKEQYLTVEYLLQRRVDNIRRGFLPEWCDFITVAVDVGMHRLHWQCDAWSVNKEVSALIEEGIEPTNVDDRGQYHMADDRDARQSMVTEAIMAALGRVRERCFNGWAKETTGEMFQPIVAVDVGGQSDEQAWFKSTIQFCHDSGPTWYATKGQRWDKSALERSAGRMYGYNPNIGYWECNADEYKRQLVRAYEQPRIDDKGDIFQGTRLLHATTSRAYCEHQTAERYIESFDPGKLSDRAQKLGWHKIRQQNHWFDTSWMSRALREIYLETKHMAEQHAQDNAGTWSIPGGMQDGEDDGSQHFGSGDPLLQ